MFENIYLQLGLSILLGALIGLQREMNQQKYNIKDFAGFRTFTLISLLGYLAGYISFEILNSIYFLLFGFAGIIIISSIAYYIISKLNPNKISITTQISAILTFIIGILIAKNKYQMSITIAILISTILFLGTKLHSFAKKITIIEAFATIKFAIISLIVLPLLPNKNYTPLEIPGIKYLFLNQNIIPQELLIQLNVFNFYHIWLMVVFISAIAYAGYILMKIIGEKGIILTGFLGGLISSTALTSSFSIESKKMKHLYAPLAVGTIIAASTMFFRILFEVSVLNPDLLNGLTLILMMMGIVGFVISLIILKKTKLNHNQKLKLSSPFSLMPAIKFSLFFLFVLVITKIFSIIYGEKGIYLLSFFSGITDVDAITISLTNLAKSGSISNITAEIGIIIAAFTNTFFKAGIACYFGSKKYFKLIIISFSIMIIIGIISIIFI